MTADEFKAWRQRLGLTQGQAAAELGVTTRTVQLWEAGDRPVPRMAELATTTIKKPAKR